MPWQLALPSRRRKKSRHHPPWSQVTLGSPQWTQKTPCNATWSMYSPTRRKYSRRFGAFLERTKKFWQWYMLLRNDCPQRALPLIRWGTSFAWKHSYFMPPRRFGILEGEHSKEQQICFLICIIHIKIWSIVARKSSRFSTASRFYPNCLGPHSYQSTDTSFPATSPNDMELWSLESTPQSMFDSQNLFLHRRIHLLFTTLAQVSLEFWAVSLNCLRETAYRMRHLHGHHGSSSHGFSHSFSFFDVNFDGIRVESNPPVPSSFLPRVDLSGSRTRRPRYGNDKISIQVIEVKHPLL